MRKKSVTPPMTESTVSLDPMNAGCQTSCQKYIAKVLLIAFLGLEVFREWLDSYSGQEQMQKT